MKDSVRAKMEIKLFITKSQLNSLQNTFIEIPKELKRSTNIVENIAPIQTEIIEAKSKLQEFLMQFEHRDDDLTQILREIKDKGSDAKKEKILS